MYHMRIGVYAHDLIDDILLVSCRATLQWEASARVRESFEVAGQPMQIATERGVCLQHRSRRSVRSARSCAVRRCPNKADMKASNVEFDSPVV